MGTFQHSNILRHFILIKEEFIKYLLCELMCRRLYRLDHILLLLKFVIYFWYSISSFFYYTFEIFMKADVIGRGKDIDDSGSCNYMTYRTDLCRMTEGIEEEQRARKTFVQNTDNSIEDLQMSSKTNFRERKKAVEKTFNIQDNFFGKNKLGLKKILKEQKIKALIKNFGYKLKRNCTSSTPIEYEPYDKQEDESLWSLEGLKIPHWFDLTFSFISVLQILCLCFIYTLALVYFELIESKYVMAIQTFSIAFYSMEILINFVSVKTIDGRKILVFKEIVKNYLSRKFFTDLICLIVLIIDVNSNLAFTRYLRLCVVLKIKECLEKMEKIENFFINNFYKEQYWALAKVFLTNFAFAHFLAVMLIAMADLSEGDNWLTKKGALERPWYEQYAWAYYWGSTIMLTVGFGDLSATNYKEAICLTLIETFSCILLAYNINCVGNLISNIRSQSIEKNKNFRIMKRLTEQNNITEDLEWKVCNHINQMDKMKKKFNFEAQKQFVSNLPIELKGELLKESNKRIFENLSFFKHLTQKSLVTLAERIQVKIAHPQQFIFKQSDEPQFMILRQGKVGYCTHLPGSAFNKTIIDVVKVGKNQSPHLLYLNFISNPVITKFQIQSLKYSMIYKISSKDLIEIIKNSAFDFERFCQLKDKSKHILHELQVLTCEHCSTKHSKMICPKLHFTLFPQIIIYRYLDRVKTDKNERRPFERARKEQEFQTLRILHKFFKVQEIVFGTKKQIRKRKSRAKFILGQWTQQNLYLTQLTKLGEKAELHTISKMLNVNSIGSLKQVEILKNKVIERNQNSEEICSDDLHDFQFYFSNQNPCQFRNFSLSKKSYDAYDENDGNNNRMYQSSALGFMKNRGFGN